MATFTNPSSRADLLLTLARLSFPDAVRRANQPVAVAILIAVLFLVFATVATFGLLPVLFTLESDALQRNLLNLMACSATAFGLLAQVALRAPTTWLLDLDDLLRLPVGFRDLYGLRFALSTMGYWLLVLGPAGAYLTVMRSGGIAGVPVTLLGIVSLVWIFGRVVAVLSLFADRWVESALTILAMMMIMALCQFAILVGVMAFGGELDSEGVARAIEGSSALGGLGYTPPGLVAGIVHEPGWSASNLARLGSLFAALGVLIVLENRLLLRSYLDHPGGDRRAASGVLPLARMLRGSRRLSSLGVLTVLETECLLRAQEDTGDHQAGRDEEERPAEPVERREVRGLPSGSAAGPWPSLPHLPSVRALRRAARQPTHCRPHRRRGPPPRCRCRIRLAPAAGTRAQGARTRTPARRPRRRPSEATEPLLTTHNHEELRNSWKQSRQTT